MFNTILLNQSIVPLCVTTIFLLCVFLIKLTTLLILFITLFIDSILYLSINTSGKSYANIHFPNAPPLVKLNKAAIHGLIGYDNPKNSEEENEKFVKLVLSSYTNKNIANFFGDLIVNYYKEDDVKDVSFLVC